MQFTMYVITYLWYIRSYVHILTLILINKPSASDGEVVTVVGGAASIVCDNDSDCPVVAKSTNDNTHVHTYM